MGDITAHLKVGKACGESIQEDEWDIEGHLFLDLKLHNGTVGVYRFYTMLQKLSTKIKKKGPG